MILSPKSLEKLRLLINEETEYRSGPQLVSFFNHLGFRDSYGQGFPSRWMFTDEKLSKLNGTPELDACIRSALNPANFIGRVEELDGHITELNKYLTFDKWKVVTLRFVHAAQLKRYGKEQFVLYNKGKLLWAD